MRSPPATERLEERDGRLAVTDEDPHSPGAKYVKFWVEEAPSNPEGGRSYVDEEASFPLTSARDGRTPATPERRGRMPHDQEVSDRNCGHGSPDFGRYMMKPTVGDASPSAIEHRQESKTANHT